jgi:hypothetical protein
MPFTHINALVRLKEDVPKLRLSCGCEGVVVSVWLLPGDFHYEVQFHRSDGSPAVRVLLRGEQLEVIGSQPTGPNKGVIKMKEQMKNIFINGSVKND